MLLHTTEHGRGDRTAVLLHGLMGSAESWSRITPLLVERGYRVLAMDLPGHGRSPRDPSMTVAKAAASVLETLEHLAPSGPIHAIGHSYGATVLAATGIDAEVVVYVDSPLAFSGIEGPQARARLVAQYDNDRIRRQDPAWLLSTRAHYTEADADVEARAASLFDPETGAAISCAGDVAFAPRRGEILVHAEPSDWVTDEHKRDFRSRGVSVRPIHGAAHTVWYSHLDEFTASVPEMFAKYP